jgi:hypothetical protein
VGRWTHGGQDGGMAVGKAATVGQFEFVEWTGDNHLRHSKFIAPPDGQTSDGCEAGVDALWTGEKRPSIHKRKELFVPNGRYNFHG